VWPRELGHECGCWSLIVGFTSIYFDHEWRWRQKTLVLRQQITVLYRQSGRPAGSADIRQLIREISNANPLWGAPRIHRELLRVRRKYSIMGILRNRLWKRCQEGIHASEAITNVNVDTGGTDPPCRGHCHALEAGAAGPVERLPPTLDTASSS